MTGFFRINTILTILFVVAALAPLAACGGDDEPPREEAPPTPEEVVAAPTTPPETDAPEPPEPPTATPAPEPAPTATLALTFSIVGGVVGFCDDLSVQTNGDYVLSSCTDPNVTGTLEEGDRELLREWYENLAGFNIHFEDNPDNADNLTIDLAFSGVGAAEADQTQQQIIFDWANGLALRLRPQPEVDIPTPTPLPPIGPDGLCPEVQRPAVIAANYDNPSAMTLIDPDSQETCQAGLQQPPFGRIVAAVDTIFYPIFDPDSQTITVWRLDRTGDSAPLAFTGVTLEQLGPFNFAVSADGSRIAWAWTTVDMESDPEAPPYFNNLRLANIDGSDQVTVLEQVENNERRYLEPVQFSPDNQTLYYAMQPDGLGGAIFSFSGRYDNMYRLPPGGGEAELIYACPQNQQSICIGDISQDGSHLAVARLGEGVVEVLDSAGNPVSSLTPPAADYVGWPVFSPTGALAFVSAALSEEADEGPPRPNPGHVSLVQPPYTGPVETIFTDNSVAALWEWVDDTRLMYGSMDEQGAIGTAIVTLDGQATRLSPNYALAVLR